jgi:DNA-binding LacI/PurR family transcriptional regulator
VSPARREAVLAAMDDMGYRVNAAARNLTRRTVGAVGVIVNDLRNPWFNKCLEGLHDGFRGHNLSMLLGDRRLDVREAEPMMNLLIDMRIDGLVLMGTMEVSDTIVAASRRIPTVMVGHQDFPLPMADSSAQDDAIGAGLAMEHLFTLGHRRIAHLSSDLGGAAAKRRAVYLDFMRTRGLAENIAIENCDLTEESGYQAAGRLLSRPSPPTAVFAVNDLACIGALSAAEERGIEVPRHLSLVGFDNTDLARSRHLQLTSIDTASRELGLQAAGMLINRMKNPSREPTHYRAIPSLVVRSSTGVAAGPELRPPGIPTRTSIPAP